MAKQMLMSDILRLKDFDPMNIDVSYIQETINLIPKSGMIDLGQAEQLATSFLRCADYCSDLVAQAIRHLGIKDALKKSSKGSAIETKIASKTPATTARETYGNDPAFMTTSEAHAEAQAFLSWIQQKHNNLIKAHVLCKDLMKAHTQVRDQSSWDSSGEENSINNSDNSSKTPIKTKDKSKSDFDFDI